MKCKIMLSIIAVLVIQGCTLGHQKFYTQLAPEKYPETKKTMLFKYANINLQGIYETFFSDYIIIGKSNFNGPIEDPTSSLDYAKSIGADVFITSAQFSITASSVVPLVTPSVSTTNISGFAGRTSYFGSATTYGTSTSYIPVSVNRYDQVGLYLRKFTTTDKPAWELTKDNFVCDSESEFNGNWGDEKYEISICKSGVKLVGFISKIKDPELELWRTDEIKLSFNSEDKKGVYFCSDKTPWPASLSLNKFGHLEISLLGRDDKFSFAKR